MTLHLNHIRLRMEPTVHIHYHCSFEHGYRARHGWKRSGFRRLSCMRYCGQVIDCASLSFFYRTLDVLLV